MNSIYDEQDILRILRGQATAEELQQFRQWLEADDSHRSQFQELKTLWNAVYAAEPADSRMQQQQRARLRKSLQRMGATRGHRLWPSHVWHWAAAVLLVSLVAGGAIILHRHAVQSAGGQEWSQQSSGQVQLTLSDGQCLELTQDDVQIDTDHERGVSSNDGVIDYTQVEPSEAIASEILYNKIETKTGSCYELRLADGSRVWLNAQTELRFPIRFEGGERRVYLTGEAYFEVAHDEEHPFVVSTQTGSLDVCVYGTHFDVDAYSPEYVRTTLLEGSVGIRDVARSSVHMLQPSNTALYNVLNGQVEITPCDAAECVLWREGILSFDEMSVEQLMRRVNRYYGVDAIYEDDSVRMVTLTGLLRYDDNLVTLLHTLESVSSLRFEQTGSCVLVRHQ